MLLLVSGLGWVVPDLGRNDSVQPATLVALDDEDPWSTTVRLSDAPPVGGVPISSVAQLSNDSDGGGGLPVKVTVPVQLLA
jgi:hypothetical protein